MSARPMVGITAARRTVNGRCGAFPAHVVDAFSVLAVSRAGGVPVLLPQLERERVEEQLRPLRALVLSGGDDVDAELYGRARHPRSVGNDGERDRWELGLAAVARERELRILGICRGAQLLNVGRGGTLHGHLDASEAHELDIIEGEARHPVAVTAGAGLATVLGGQPLAVASSHHQAIDDLGAGLAVCATAPDGVIEAIEAEEGAEIGVQWHPEFQLDERAGQPLFDWLVDKDGGWRSPA